MSKSSINELRPDQIRPEDQFRTAERAARSIRKLLRSQEIALRRQVRSKSVDDAILKAELVEQLARYGQTLGAAEASDLAFRLERLVHDLAAEVLAFLADTISV